MERAISVSRNDSHDEQGRISTIDALQGLGFVSCNNPIPGTYSFDFGNFKLDALKDFSEQHFDEMVGFTANLASTRTLSFLFFEIPTTVESLDLLKALLAYYIDRHAKRELQPAVVPNWLIEGRMLQHLLPWERDKKAYEARPRCQLGRKWARLLLDSLRLPLAQADDNALVEFTFNGTIFAIRCGEHVFAAVAQGKIWDCEYAVTAKNMRNIPRRLMADPVCVSYYEGRINIDRYRYRCASCPGEANPAEGEG